MEKQRGRAVRRAVRGIVAAAVFAVPAASGATTWVGQTRERVVCSGQGHYNGYYNFTLDMEPGLALGNLTYAGSDPIQMITQWTTDGKLSYFTAVGSTAAGDQITFFGVTRGFKMKGELVYSGWSSDCMSIGQIRGFQE